MSYANKASGYNFTTAVTADKRTRRAFRERIPIENIADPETYLFDMSAFVRVPGLTVYLDDGRTQEERILGADPYAAEAKLIGGITNNDWFFRKLPSDVDTGAQAAIDAVQALIDNHKLDTDNPHSVTKAQLGLGNIDNTADINKPVSTAQQNAINAHANSVSNPHAVSFSQLSDKDRVVQSATVVANANGVLVLDTSKSVSVITLTGNITGISFANNPGTTEFTDARLDIYQDVTGGWTIDWVGCGAYTEDAKVAEDLQPLATAGSLTQYWLSWTGSFWVITLIKVSANAL